MTIKFQENRAKIAGRNHLSRNMHFILFRLKMHIIRLKGILALLTEIVSQLFKQNKILHLVLVCTSI